MVAEKRGICCYFFTGSVDKACGSQKSDIACGSQKSVKTYGSQRSDKPVCPDCRLQYDIKLCLLHPVPTCQDNILHV